MGGKQLQGHWKVLSLESEGLDQNINSITVSYDTIWANFESLGKFLNLNLNRFTEKIPNYEDSCEKYTRSGMWELRAIEAQRDNFLPLGFIPLIMFLTGTGSSWRYIQRDLTAKLIFKNPKDAYQILVLVHGSLLQGNGNCLSHKWLTHWYHGIHGQASDCVLVISAILCKMGKFSSVSLSFLVFLPGTCR